MKQFTDLWAGENTFAQGKGNNREVMPINDRTLYTSNDSPMTTADEEAKSPLMKLYPLVGILDLSAGVWNMMANDDNTDDWSKTYFS